MELHAPTHRILHRPDCTLSDLAHHGYIVSVTDDIEVVCSILYWNTEILLGSIERLYRLGIN